MDDTWLGPVCENCKHAISVEGAEYYECYENLIAEVYGGSTLVLPSSHACRKYEEKREGA